MLYQSLIVNNISLEGKYFQNKFQRKVMSLLILILVQLFPVLCTLLIHVFRFPVSSYLDGNEMSNFDGARFPNSLELL